MKILSVPQDYCQIHMMIFWKITYFYGLVSPNNFNFKNLKAKKNFNPKKFFNLKIF